MGNYSFLIIRRRVRGATFSEEVQLDKFVSSSGNMEVIQIQKELRRQKVRSVHPVRVSWEQNNQQSVCGNAPILQFKYYC